MKTIRNLATLAAVATMFATFGAGRARAQVAVRGTFTLPFQARWGSANLPPGSYRFEVFESEGSGNDVREVMVWSRTKGKSPVYILGQVDGDASPTKANALLCVRQRSTCLVQTLQLGVAAETLSFLMRPLPNTGAEARKRKTGMLQAKAHEHVQRVPITFSGK